MQTYSLRKNVRSLPLSSAWVDVTVAGNLGTGQGTFGFINLSTRIDKPIPNAWCRWEFDWHTPSKPGKPTLIARAMDSKGRIQPIERDPDRGTYMINHLLPITVEVR